MTQSWRLPSFRLCLALFALLIGFDALMLARTSITLSIDDVTQVAAAECCLAIVGLAGWLVHHLSVDDHATARAFRKAGLGVFHSVQGFAFLVAFNTAALVATYLALAVGMPFQDAAFSTVDQIIGLDWLGLMSWANDHPAIGQLLCWAYDSMLPQMCLAIAILSLSARPQALWDFLALAALSLTITIAISMIAPALDPYTYYAPDPSLYQALEQMKPEVGRDFIPHMMQLHSGTFTALNFFEMHGIVSFPSYHTIVGLILIYSARNSRYLAWPVFVLNAVLILSTMPIGGHYLADVLAGGVVFLVSLAIVEHLNGRAMSTQPSRDRAAEAYELAGLARGVVVFSRLRS